LARWIAKANIADEHIHESLDVPEQGKTYPIFDSYLESIIADSSPELATTINNTTFWLSLKN